MSKKARQHLGSDKSSGSDSHFVLPPRIFHQVNSLTQGEHTTAPTRRLKSARCKRGRCSACAGLVKVARGPAVPCECLCHKAVETDPNL